MRHRSEVTLIVTLAAFALAGLTAMRMLAPDRVAYVDPVVDPITVTIEPVDAQPVAAQPVTDDAAAWFQSFRMYCNPVDVETRMRWQPAPGSPEGEMHKAACYALAGKIDRARSVIDGLPQPLRYRAAGVVFEAGHPAADAGDDVAAGPLMELVVEYWPNHYMALYHAGAAAYARGDYAVAPDYLERFLQEYSVQDGWRSNALRMLEEMARTNR